MMDTDHTPESADQQALMSQHGITRVPADRYHYKEWRYSNLADAVAQARRDAACS